MMSTCPICGTRRVIYWPELWPYRRRNNYLCSENCLIAFDTIDYKERVGWIEKRKKGQKAMDNNTKKRAGRPKKVAEPKPAEIPMVKEADIKPGAVVTEADIIHAQREKVTRRAKRDGFKVSAIRNSLGEFAYDEKHNKLDWRAPGGEEVSMDPKCWFDLYMAIPDVMGILGVEDEHD